MSDNYLVVTVRSGSHHGEKWFHTKKQAIAHARLLSILHHTFIESKPGKTTYMLPKGECSCRVCGNELSGKKHCPLCKAHHYYV